MENEIEGKDGSLISKNPAGSRVSGLQGHSCKAGMSLSAEMKEPSVLHTSSGAKRFTLPAAEDEICPVNGRTTDTARARSTTMAFHFMHDILG